MIYMANAMYTSLLFLSISSLFFSLGQADISTTQFLRDSEELVSSNSIFVLGFFSPANSSDRYAGIWYNRNESDDLEVVWIANRNNPINDNTGVLQISEDGNLQVLNGKTTSFGHQI